MFYVCVTDMQVVLCMVLVECSSEHWSYVFLSKVCTHHDPTFQFDVTTNTLHLTMSVALLCCLYWCALHMLETGISNHWTGPELVEWTIWMVQNIFS